MVPEPVRLGLLRAATLGAFLISLAPMAPTVVTPLATHRQETHKATESDENEPEESGQRSGLAQSIASRPSRSAAAIKPTTNADTPASARKISTLI